MTTRSRNAWWTLLTLVGNVWAWALVGPAYGQDEIIDSLMFADPRLPTATVQKVFSQRLLPLWLQALEQPELELKFQAAAAISLAQRRGMTGLEKAVPPLLGTLDQPDQHLSVRLAAAKALIALDARESAGRLFEHARTDGIEMRDLVEPALARWDYRPMREVWLERLQEAKLPGRGWLLAIEGLEAVKELKAAPRLRELVLAPSTDSISRLAAARALGVLVTHGLELDAQRLMAEKTEPDGVSDLLAASLLRHHRGDAAAKILQQLAVEAGPAAESVALDALLEDDPHRVLPLMARVLANRDPAVRTRGVQAFLKGPSADQIGPIVGLLNDPHPLVRISARKALAVVASKAAFGSAIRDQAMRRLAGTQWRELEQATILLAVLDHKAAAPRMVELLQFHRPEVFVAAAWGLRKLAVPQTLPAQVAAIEARLQAAIRPDSNYPFEMINRQLVQLCESVGVAKYAPAGPVLARFIPKSTPTGPRAGVQPSGRWVSSMKKLRLPT